MIRRLRPVLLSALLVLPQLAQAASANSETTPAMINPQQARQIDAIFEPFTHGGPGCVVGISKDLAPVYSKGFGLANLDYDEPITPDTVFQLASISKQFTAMATVTLAHEGGISLDDDIRKYVPEVPDYGSPITIREILNHTNGLRDIYMLGTLRGESEKDYYSPDQFLDLIGRQKHPIFEPGTGFRYGNSGYLLLGIMIERVTGLTLAQYAKSRIFDPLGMTHSFFEDDMTRVVKNRATGYYAKEGGGYTRGVTLLEMPGDGGVMTTIGDLMLWDRDFYEGKVWRDDIKADMLKPGKLRDGSPASFPVETNGVYASGLILGERRGLPIIRHGGTFVGFKTDLVRYPQQKLGIAVLCNLGGADPNQLANRVADVLLEGVYPEPAPAAAEGAADEVPPALPPIAPALLEELPGTYYSDELQTRYRIVRSGDTLQILISERRVPLNPAEYMSSPLGQLGKDTIGNEVFAFSFKRDGPRISGFDLSLLGGLPFTFTRVE